MSRSRYFSKWRSRMFKSDWFWFHGRRVELRDEIARKDMEAGLREARGAAYHWFDYASFEEHMDALVEAKTIHHRGKRTRLSERQKRKDQRAALAEIKRTLARFRDQRKAANFGLKFTSGPD